MGNHPPVCLICKNCRTLVSKYRGEDAPHCRCASGLWPKNSTRTQSGAARNQTQSLPTNASQCAGFEEDKGMKPLRTPYKVMCDILSRHEQRTMNGGA